MIEEFAAPWGLRLIVTTSAVAMLLAGVVIALSRRLVGFGRIVAIGLIVALEVGMLSTAILNYQINDDAIMVRQAWSEVEIPLQSLQSVDIRPHAMDKSRRTNGNEGVFAISGRYSNEALGNYRAYVTDPSRTVVLRTSTGIVVLSPDRPEDFVTSVRARAQHVQRR
jgi:Bacterial PH domain